MSYLTSTDKTDIDGKALQGRTGASARFPEGNRAAQVPAERSGAACPTGAVTAGDWG